jgi:chromosome segregation ATPase
VQALDQAAERRAPLALHVAALERRCADYAAEALTARGEAVRLRDGLLAEEALAEELRAELAEKERLAAETVRAGRALEGRCEEAEGVNRRLQTEMAQLREAVRRVGAQRAELGREAEALEGRAAAAEGAGRILGEHAAAARDVLTWEVEQVRNKKWRVCSYVESGHICA